MNTKVFTSTLVSGVRDSYVYGGVLTAAQQALFDAYPGFNILRDPRSIGMAPPLHSNEALYFEAHRSVATTEAPTVPGLTMATLYLVARRDFAAARLGWVNRFIAGTVDRVMKKLAGREPGREVPNSRNALQQIISFDLAKSDQDFFAGNLAQPFHELAAIVILLAEGTPHKIVAEGYRYGESGIAAEVRSAYAALGWDYPEYLDRALDSSRQTTYGEIEAALGELDDFHQGAADLLAGFGG